MFFGRVSFTRLFLFRPQITKLPVQFPNRSTCLSHQLDRIQDSDGSSQEMGLYYGNLKHKILES